jgi:hypothetical protein
MSTVRAALTQAMRLLKAIAPGDSPTADELAVGLEAAQQLVMEIHEARGPLFDVDVPPPISPPATPPTSGTICPGENQRLRIQAGYTATVELPNSVSIFGTYDPYDYGFQPSTTWTPQVGSLGAADGVYFRAPTDGARIEIVGTSQGLYFYRADTNAWLPALGLTIDAELPFDARLAGAFAALLAERLADVLANLPQPTPAQKARILHAREAMFSQTGRHRAPTRGEYF